MTLSASNSFAGVTRMLNPQLHQSVEKSCEREVKFLALRYGIAGEPEHGQLLAKRLIDNELTGRI